MIREKSSADSGSIAALCVLEQLCRAGVPLSELRRPFERYVQSGEINSRVDDPAAFQACFRDWVQAVCDGLGLKHIAIDGKTLCGSGSDKLKALHLVSAWAADNQLTLAQVATDEKSNEITAIPQLLELLCLKGALVTIDAMGCQKDIAAKIVAGGGDYVLTVKDNQPSLLSDIQDSFIQAHDTDFAGLDYDEYETTDRGHGRIEKRSYTIIKNPTTLQQKDLWAELKVIGMCVSTRIVKDKESTEVRYFIGSRIASAKKYGATLRGHSLSSWVNSRLGKPKARCDSRSGSAAARKLGIGR